MFLAGARTNAAALTCSGSHAYDATEKASIAALLRTNYGDASKSFDLDHPSSIDVGDRKLPSLVIGRSSWLAFSRGEKPHPAVVPSRIVVGFDTCSGRAVTLQVVR